MTCRTRTLLPVLLLLAAAGCSTDGDRTADAELRAESRAAAATAWPAGSMEARPEPTLRRLWAGDYVDFYASSVSPDGRYMSMIDWSTGDLAVRDLSTGTLQRLTAVQNDEGKPWEDANVSVFSPDGRRIVVGWQVSPDIQLRVLHFEPDENGVPLITEPEVIFHNPEFDPYYPFDWSPDGTQILAKVYTAGNTSQLALISVEDGSYRALKSFDWREPLRAEFSPNGRFVAYDFLLDADAHNRDVFVMSLDGTYEQRVVDGPAVDRLLGWHPGGAILFHSDRGGSPGVWHLPMTDGRPAGPAELVRADMPGVEPLGFADGRFYYGVNVNPPRLYTASADFETGRMVGVPAAVEDPARMEVLGWDWSPDGKFLAYSGEVPGAGGSLIVIRSDRGEEVRALRLDLGAARRIRWTPDGGSLIAFARDDKGRGGFHRIDLETGSYTTIVRNDQLDHPTPRGDFDISPDGRTIWFATGLPGTRDIELLAYDLVSGASRSITPAEWQVRPGAMGIASVRLAVSPDGTRLAVFAPDTISSNSWIGTIPARGGPFTPLAPRGFGNVIHQGPEWTADGRSVVFSTYAWDSWPEGGYTTWMVSADGGEARTLDLVEGHAGGGRVKLNPDGRRVTFLAGEPRGEVWVMDGLGRSTEASKEEGSR
jgi:Tol biopolymer transport system component